jgi:hypothetical protein
MARIRLLKPDFFLDEDLAEISMAARLAFEGLWVQADKKGRLEDRPKYLKATIFPYNDVDMNALLDELAGYNKKVPFITRYTVGGKKYIQINNFLKHQNPHHTEKDSVIPAPEDGDKKAVTVKERLNNGEAPDKREVKEREDKDKENEGGGQGNPPSPSSDYTEDFKAFWQVYPRKMGKTAAFKAWNARLKEKVSPDDLIKAAKNYAAKCKADKTEERYIKHAETFLGPNKRYEDYLGGNPDDPPEKPLTPGQIRIREALEKMKDIKPLI